MKPEYPLNPKVQSVSRDARLLNIHLWNLADDEGRLPDLPNWIAGSAFPCDTDITTDLVNGWLTELEDSGLIVRYRVEKQPLIQVHDWHDHQKINRPAPSQYPAPDSASQAAARVVTDKSLTGHGLVSDGMERKGKEGKGKEGIRVANPSATESPLSHLLADLIAANDPNGKRPTPTKRWADAERLMLKADGRKLEEAERLIRWCQSDEFWRGNVLSMPTFRQRYGQLYQAAVKAKRKERSAPVSDGMANARRMAERIGAVA